MAKIIYRNTKPKYMKVYLNWPNIDTTILSAGTPIGANGTVCNNDSAIGILANDVGKTTYVQECQIIIAGELDLSAVQSSFGANLTAECKNALDNIAFIQSNGKPYVPASELPSHTAADNGKVLKLVNNAPVWGYDNDPSFSVDSTKTVVIGTPEAVTVETSGDGAITAISSDTAKATVTVEGTTITITGVAAGESTVTVKQAATVSYRGATGTIAVTVTEPEEEE